MKNIISIAIKKDREQRNCIHIFGKVHIDKSNSSLNGFAYRQCIVCKLRDFSKETMELLSK